MTDDQKTTDGQQTRQQNESQEKEPERQKQSGGDFLDKALKETRNKLEQAERLNQDRKQ